MTTLSPSPSIASPSSASSLSSSLTPSSPSSSLLSPSSSSSSSAAAADFLALTEIRSLGTGTFGQVALVCDLAGRQFVRKRIQFHSLDTKSRYGIFNEIFILQSYAKAPRKHPAIVEYFETILHFEDDKSNDAPISTVKPVPPSPAASSARRTVLLGSESIESYKSDLLHFDHVTVDIVLGYCTEGDLAKKIEQRRKLKVQYEKSQKTPQHQKAAQSTHRSPNTYRQSIHTIRGASSSSASASAAASASSSSFIPPFYFTEDDVWRYFLHICVAVHFLHGHHILHRDLKPSNCLINSANQIQLADFGVSKIFHRRSSTASDGSDASASDGDGDDDDLPPAMTTSTMIGTPLQLSPEICAGQHYNQKSDVWSIGVILYELLCLVPPFHATTLPALANRITNDKFAPIPKHYSAELQWTVDRFLQKKAENRMDLKEFLSIPSVEARMKKLLISTEPPKIFLKNAISAAPAGAAGGAFAAAAANALASPTSQSSSSSLAPASPLSDNEKENGVPALRAGRRSVGSEANTNLNEWMEKMAADMRDVESELHSLQPLSAKDKDEPPKFASPTSASPSSAAASAVHTPIRDRAQPSSIQLNPSNYQIASIYAASSAASASASSSYLPPQSEPPNRRRPKVANADMPPPAPLSKAKDNPPSRSAIKGRPTNFHAVAQQNPAQQSEVARGGVMRRRSDGVPSHRAKFSAVSQPPSARRHQKPSQIDPSPRKNAIQRAEERWKPKQVQRLLQRQMKAEPALQPSFSAVDFALTPQIQPAAPAVESSDVYSALSPLQRVQLELHEQKQRIKDFKKERAAKKAEEKAAILQRMMMHKSKVKAARAKIAHDQSNAFQWTKGSGPMDLEDQQQQDQEHDDDDEEHAAPTTEEEGPSTASASSSSGSSNSSGSAGKNEDASAASAVFTPPSHPRVKVLGTSVGRKSSIAKSRRATYQRHLSVHRISPSAFAVGPAAAAADKEEASHSTRKSAPRANLRDLIGKSRASLGAKREINFELVLDRPRQEEEEKDAEKKEEEEEEAENVVVMKDHSRGRSAVEPSEEEEEKHRDADPPSEKELLELSQTLTEFEVKFAEDGQHSRHASNSYLRVASSAASTAASTSQSSSSSSASAASASISPLYDIDSSSASTQLALARDLCQRNLGKALFDAVSALVLDRLEKERNKSLTTFPHPNHFVTVIQKDEEIRTIVPEAQRAALDNVARLVLIEAISRNQQKK